MRVFHIDDRQPGANTPPRILPAFSASMISHAALLLCLTLAFRETQQRDSTESTASDLSALAKLVWVSGGDGGGGGGGNENPRPPRRLQRSGTDPVSTPAVRTNIVSLQESASEPDLAIVVPALPLAADNLTLPGAMTASFSIDSLGPGTRRGVGSGSGGGDGPGSGVGFGPGDGLDTGGGPGGGGARIVMPTVIRDVKPQYTSEAMRARIQGAVIVRAIVQPDGTVRDVQVIRSLDPIFGLDQAAIRAASQWLFRPALMAGKPVPLAVTIELVFTLR